MSNPADHVEVSSPWTDRGWIATFCGEMHYVAVGHGPPIVLLPKMGGWVADWRRIAPLLCDNRRAIAIDLPGYGESAARGEPPYVVTIEESAVAIAAALDTLGYESYDLVGNSLGGDVGLAMSVFWPERVRSLTMISSSLGGPMSLADLEARDARNFYSNFDANDVALPVDPAAMTPGWFVDPAIGHESNAARRRAGRWLKPTSRGISHADLPDLLRRCEVPTLLVYGEDGHFANFEQEALALLRDARSVRTPRGSSLPHEDFPDALAPLLIDFHAETRRNIR